MSRIRVLHCIHSLVAGGGERQLRVLADASHQQSMDASIFCVNDAGSDIRDSSVPIYKSKRQNKYNLSIFGSLNMAIDDFRPDVVHAWLPASVTIPAMVVARLKGIPSVYSYRSRMFFGRLLTIPEYLVALTTASQVVSNNAVRRSNIAYRLLYRAKNGMRISNAVSADAGWRKTSYRTHRDAPCNVLYAGRISDLKNWQCLLRAVSLIELRNTITLTICGTGEQEEELLVMVRDLGISANIRYLGYRNDIHKIMQSSDVLALPSWSEGMPNVLLEALHLGLPCIVSDIPAHRDIVGTTESVLFFDPRDPGDLAKRICQIRDNPESAKRLAEHGLTITENLSAARMARAHYEVYSRMIANRNGVL